MERHGRMARVFENDKSAVRMDKKIKVAYICHYSNDDIHQRLPLTLDLSSRILLALNHLPQNTDVQESAVWNTNAINELKKFSDRIELHVISPYKYLKPSLFEYEKDGIYYHFYRNDDDTLLLIAIHKLLHKGCKYKRTRKKVRKLIQNIDPAIIHVVGVENPQYSICALDVPANIPLLAQLQTLMSDPKFESNYPISHAEYLYRSEIESSIIKRTNYIGTPVTNFMELIHDKINPKAFFLNTVLALAEPVNVIQSEEKQFDFVYFSAEISKASDLAIEAYIIAAKKHSKITLNIVGSYSLELKKGLENRLMEDNLLQNVTFSGKLPSHDDVIKQIRLSRFALLPLKIDFVSGTIREALANGLPVVTTITSGTPTLNEKRETVLLSKIGDYQAMADNMCHLIEDSELVDRLRLNGGIYMEELDSNASRVKKYVEIYDAVLNHFHKGIPIPNELLSF